MMILLGMIDSCVFIHQSVANSSKLFLQQMARHNYVTPTSYLELMKIFSKMIGFKISELKTNKDRMKIGLDKVK